MAAFEYYNPGASMAASHAPDFQNVQPPPNHHQNPTRPSYPTYDGPPPAYSNLADTFQSHQQQHQQRPQPSFSTYHHHSFPQHGQTHQYPPEKLPQQPQPSNGQRPADLPSPYLTPHPPQASQVAPQPSGFTRHGKGKAYARPLSQPGPSAKPKVRLPISPDRSRSPSSSRSRSRSRSRERRRRQQRGGGDSKRPEATRRKGSGVNTFFGASGGALLGDLIFPGLGTIGGAILGGVGGHEYSKRSPSNSGPGREKKRSYSNGAAYYEDEHRRGRR